MRKFILYLYPTSYFILSPIPKQTLYKIDEIGHVARLPCEFEGLRGLKVILIHNWSIFLFGLLFSKHTEHSLKQAKHRPWLVGSFEWVQPALCSFQAAAW